MSVESVSPILFEGVSAVTTTPSVELGSTRTVAGERYVYVYNAGGAATGVGVGLSRPVSAAAGIYSLSASSISGDVCGGFVKHVTIGAGQYGWALTKGLVNVAVSSFASSQSAGPKVLGANGAIATAGISTGDYTIGELTTLIVSGNSGMLLVMIP
jgi:hypothetical protein